MYALMLHRSSNLAASASRPDSPVETGLSINTASDIKAAIVHSAGHTTGRREHRREAGVSVCGYLTGIIGLQHRIIGVGLLRRTVVGSDWRG
jgi:hypothetical protein